MRRGVLLIFGLLVVVTVGLVATTTLRRPATFHGTRLRPPIPAAPFTLETAGGPVALSDFRGRLVVLFFGYTSCPDVCPTTLLRLADALSRLEARRDEVQVVFVTVDPERDTPERVARYAAAVDPGFVGVSGPPDRIRKVATSYGTYYERVEGSDATGYLVDHTATVTVVDRRGRVALLWAPDVDAAAMADDLRALLGAGDVAGEVGLEVMDAWVRLPVGAGEESGGPVNTAAYLVLRNADAADDALVAVDAAVAAAVELHTVTMDDGVMRMRQVDEIPVPAGGRAELRPGGFHVMLIGLGRMLAEGDTVPLTLRLRSGRSVQVDAVVHRRGGH